MNFYQILGIRATATDQEIEAAYKAVSENTDLERRLEASMAYTVLTDPERRDQFDEELLRTTRRQVIELPEPTSRPAFDRLAQNEYYHHHYHSRIAPEGGDYSLLKTGVVWFIMAMATVFVFFFMAIVVR